MKEYDRFEDFVEKIKKSSNAASSEVYYADEKKYNVADWKAKSKKLAEVNAAPVDPAYPKDILTPQAIFSKQLRWMKEKDFSNQIKASIKEIFPERYEFILCKNTGKATSFVGATTFCVNGLKEVLRENV